MSTSQKPFHKISQLTIFLWWCSGADIDLLKNLPSEKNKYSLVGVSILGASFFAGFSGGYIFSIVFQSVSLGILFGIMWGSLIFMLERYTISIVQKKESNFATLKNAIPTLFISLLLATLVSVPLTFKLFEDRIKLEYHNQVNEVMSKMRNSFDLQQQPLRDKIQLIISNESKQKLAVDSLHSKYIAEIYGTKSGSGILGKGPRAIFLEREYNIAQITFDKLKNRNDSVIKALSSEISSLENEKLAAKNNLSLQPTFFDMYQSLSKLRRENSAINWASILITLFFYAFYSLPTVIKIILQKGPYDTLEKIRDEIIVRNSSNQDVSIEESNIIVGNQLAALQDKYQNINSENIINELQFLKNVKEAPSKSNFENYLTKMLDDFIKEANKTEKRTKTLYWQGITFSIIGIMTAFGFLAFWLNYFSIKKFETYHLFALGSGTIIILLIEFLGAWFLKQHRLTTARSLHILTSKAVLDRYLLIYLAIEDFVGTDKKGDYLNQLLHTLNKDLIFPNTSKYVHDNSDFANDTFSSIANIAKNVKH